MPYEVRVDDADGAAEDSVVEVRSWGRAAIEEHLEARKQALQAAHARGVRRIMVDLRDLSTKGAISTMDLYDFGATCRRQNLPSGLRVACVVPTEPEGRDDVRFVTDVAANRGLVIELFDDFEEAWEWLVGTDSDCPSTRQLV